MQKDKEKGAFNFAKWLFPKRNKDGDGREQLKKPSKKFALCVAGVLFLVIVGLFISGVSGITQKSTKNQNSQATSVAVSGKDYASFIETRLTNILNSVKGISNAKVFVSVDSSPKITYAEDRTETENNGNKTVTTSIVLSKDGSLTTPVVVVEYYPQIVGVLVVAKGAGDIKTQMMLSDTISAVLNVGSSCIQILEGR